MAYLRSRIRPNPLMAREKCSKHVCVSEQIYNIELYLRMMHNSEYMTHTDYNFSVGPRAVESYLKTITWYYHYIISNRSPSLHSFLESIGFHHGGVRVIARKMEFISMCEVHSSGLLPTHFYVSMYLDY